MNKTKTDYLKIIKEHGWKGYRFFFERGALGRGWNLMYSPDVAGKTWQKLYCWFNKHPLK